MRIIDWRSDVCSSDLCATGSNTEDQPMAENKLVEARTVGIVGARGHTGAELIRLIAGHPRFELVLVSSRELDGQPVSAHVAEYEGSLRYANVPHESLGDFRSEEHTSELQSLMRNSYAVFCLKKKNTRIKTIYIQP